MEREIFVKTLNPNYIETEIETIGFDHSYKHHAIKKNQFKTIKIFNLRPQEASILKQTALSLGFDAAVNRGVLDCSVQYSDAILTASITQFEKLTLALTKQPFKMKTVSELIKNLIFAQPTALQIKNINFDWSRTYLMGILNITPDSFSDGGMYNSQEKAVKHFISLYEDGADIIDIGAESTRPNHTQITPEEEIKRLKPILDEIQALNLEIPISIDTRNVKTAEFAINNGANLINDVGFDDFNYEMIEFVNQNKIPYILTHNKKIQTHSADEIFRDFTFIMNKITSPLILDIGIGFGKTPDENYELISRAKEFKSLNKPVMVGHSRKSFLSKTFGFTNKELDEATIAISSKLILDKIDILRVHDIKKHKQLLNVLSKLN